MIMPTSDEFSNNEPRAMARVTIDRRLEQVVSGLETAFAGGRGNVFLLLQAGGVAGLLDRADLLARLGKLLEHLSVADFFQGAITNINLADVDASRLKKFSSPQEMARQHPLCDDECLVARISARPYPHVKLCLDGNIEAAAKAATSQLELGDIGCTLAALGQFDQAAAFIDSKAVDESARSAVRFVIFVEHCRRCDREFIQSLHESSPDHGGLEIVLALAGRLPWVGYPYYDW
jgi:hypothetical protein